MNQTLSDKITIDNLLEVAHKLNYRIFDSAIRDFDLNIWGIRSVDENTNTFNDIITQFWKFNGVWHIEKFAFTSEPGDYYMKRPIQKTGTHILKEGQNLKSHMIGKHRGQYDCLKQIKPMVFYTDGDKDNILDRVNPQSLTIGCNIHSTIAFPCDIKTYPFHQGMKGILVKNWSAACQVLADPFEYQKFMFNCYEAEKSYGNCFSYTLINEKDINEVI